MLEGLGKRLAEAVSTERISKEYAIHFYKAEAGAARLFSFDTTLLDSIIRPGGRLLDAMMARGRHVLHFARKGQQVSGNDINPYMVDMVRADLKREGLNATLHNLDVTDLSKIRDNTFDYVICMYNSFGCVPKAANRQRAMLEFARVAKPNGLVIAHAYNRDGQLWTPSDLWWTLKDRFWRSPGLEQGDMLYYHSSLLGHSYMHYFSHSEFRNIFSKAGLKVVREYCLGHNQKSLVSGPFKTIRSDGFIFVGKKL